MILLKNPIVLVCCIVICIVVFYVANTMNLIGKTINKFFPCNENIITSAPCYAVYDIAAMILSVMLGITFLVMLVLQVINR